ncbi:MAG: TM0106 family RecB-like putative nuclease, partial [Steroidobacteraceae bacterium]
HRVVQDAVGDPRLKDPVSPFVQLLWERGTLFERETIATLGEAFTDLSAFSGDDKERRTREAIARGDALIYSGRLTVDELLGEPDLLRREKGGYVAVDIKSGAGKAGADEDAGEEGKLKKPYGVQLALYTDILIRLDVSAGRFGYIWDVHGQEMRYDLDTPLGPRSPCLWEIYLATRLALQRSLADPASSQPAATAACKLCVWHTACLQVLMQARDLTLLPELGRAKRDALAGQFSTLEELAAENVERFCHGEKKTDFTGIGASTLRKFQRRAELAVTPEPVPYLTRPVVWPSAEVELFFDIETDPMRDLCYLHGLVIREGGPGSAERFEGIFATEATPAAEQEAFAAAMARFRAYPSAAVVHYSKYERTEYRKLQRKYPQIATAEEIEALFTRPRALDLYFDVVKPGSEWPTRDFSVKSLAKCCGFQWRDADPSGASSIEWFDRWAKTADPSLKQRLLDYNQDDCVAMRVVMDAMKSMRLQAA